MLALTKPAINYTYRKIQGVYEIGYRSAGRFKVVQATTDWGVVIDFISKNCS